MIQSVYIKNFALVEELSVEFGPGLNIITGETGAGKSILVNAIAQLCGERSSTSLVRNESKKAIIEAGFSIVPWPDIETLVEELEIEIEDFSSIILRKEINTNGNTRTFINDSPVTLNKLNAFSSMLVDLHGQHQHQRLLHPENHLAYLDGFGTYEKQLRRFAELLIQYKNNVAKLKELKTQQYDSFQKQDMYKYQCDELNKAELSEGELEELQNELKVLANIETLHQVGEALGQLLYSGESNAGNMLTTAGDNLAKLEHLDAKFSGLKENIASARDTVEEIGRFTEQYLSELEFSPQRMEYLHQRIAQLEFLLKKYQKKNISELLLQLDEMRRLLDNTEQFDELIKAQQDQVDTLVLEVNVLGAGISELRKKTASDFESEITQVMAAVGMPQADFRIRFSLIQNKSALPFKFESEPVSAESTGFDKIMFEIASNQGSVFTPIHKTASGGEISRLMLSLKSVLARTDKIPSLVFDEIDAGISGKIAQIVGVKLAKLSQFHQILCITHLPQIAAFANRHYKVEKYTEDLHTFVDMQSLDEQQRETEIANLLGGKDISDQAIENARHLIFEAQKL